MGYINDEAIIVTGHSADALSEPMRRARDLGLSCTDVAVHNINSGASFLIVPDGSKEGWSDSDRGDERRAAWIKWARETGGFRWVHVSYDDEGDCDVVSHWRGDA